MPEALDFDPVQECPGGCLVVDEVDGAGEDGGGAQCGEAVEHEDAAAQPVGADLEAGAAAGIGILPDQPVLVWCRSGSLAGGVVAVVEDHFQMPVGGSTVVVRVQRILVEVPDALEEALGVTGGVEAREFGGGAPVHGGAVLGRVVIADGVAEAVVLGLE
ncbi:hypothetical protein BJQ89_03466 [Arthrobacter sp. ES1]|nr:hypothetical protein [Arthrobacter sp. ES1]